MEARVVSPVVCKTRTVGAVRLVGPRGGCAAAARLSLAFPFLFLSVSVMSGAMSVMTDAQKQEPFSDKCIAAFRTV